MPRLASTGAAAFIAAPILAAVGVLASTTMSDEAADQVAAFAGHRGAMIGGTVLQTIGIVLFLGGIVWLATTLAPHARGLAAAGGIVGVAGSLVILFEDGATAATAGVVAALDPAHATTAVDRIHSGALGALEPVSLLQAIGCLLLALSALRAGVPRWAAALFALGGFVDTIGFAAASKPLTVIGFAVLLAGLLPLARTLVRPGAHPAVVVPAQ
jgi:hypothetical protein